MALHPQIETLLARRRGAGAPHAGLPRVEEVAEVRIPRSGGGIIPARRYSPYGERRHAIVVYLHGGGALTSSLGNGEGVCRALAIASGCVVVEVAYRTAPEHPFPAASDDVHEAIRRLARREPDGGTLVLVGESLGGNLAAVATIRARDRRGPPIALQVLAYPIVDHELSTRARDGDCLLLGREQIERFWRQYVPVAAQLDSHWASPLRAPDLSGLPPAHVLVAEHDPVRDQGLAYAQRLAAAGVHVTVERHDDMIHGFLPMVGLVDGANAAIRSIGSAIRAVAAP